MTHDPQLLDLDWTVLVQLGIFLVVMFLLTRLLWRPYLRVRSERVSRVDGYRRDAERMEAEAAERLARAESELAEVRRVGSGERALARQEARAREQTVLAEAQAEAQRTLAEAGKRLEATLQAERAKVEVTARELGRQAVRRILGREVPA
jgi:F-type H+-transporting ATPase subunit b